MLLLNRGAAIMCGLFVIHYYVFTDIIRNAQCAMRNYKPMCGCQLKAGA